MIAISFWILFCHFHPGFNSIRFTFSFSFSTWILDNELLTFRRSLRTERRKLKIAWNESSPVLFFFCFHFQRFCCHVFHFFFFSCFARSLTVFIITSDLIMLRVWACMYFATKRWWHTAGKRKVKVFLTNHNAKQKITRSTIFLRILETENCFCWFFFFFF